MKEEKQKRPNGYLRRERELRGWSQRALAEMLDTTESLISLWESGRHKPNRHFQTQLCKLFGKTAEDLGFMGHLQEAEELGFVHSTILPPQEMVSLREDHDLLPGHLLLHMPSGDSATQFGGFLAEETMRPHRKEVMIGSQFAQILALIHQWQGMAQFSHELQYFLDQEIKVLHGKNVQDSDVYHVSRRSFLIALASLPKAQLVFSKQRHKLVLALEDFLPQCAASITACWHLSGENHLEVIEALLDSYLSTLISIVTYAPLYRQIAANFITQVYSLKAILAWHLQGLPQAEAHCLQALKYSQIAEDINLKLTALNQHALILFYANKYQEALKKSEEADALTRQTDQTQAIFPIMQGRVCMYLAAFQAQQGSSAEAERTLERATQGFEVQMSLKEPLPLYADCAHASLTLWSGWTRFFLGKQNEVSKEQALTSLRTFGQLHPDSAIPERFRLECLNGRILAAIQMNERDEAITCFKAAKTGAKELESKQRLMEVNHAYHVMLQTWPTKETAHFLQEVEE